MAFKKLTKPFEDGTRFKFEEIGDSVEGILVEAKLIQSKTGGKPFYRYVVKSGDENKSFLGGYQLDQLLSEGNIPLGTMIRVTFTGDKNIGGGKKMKDYDVEIEEKAA